MVHIHLFVVATITVLLTGGYVASEETGHPIVGAECGKNFTDETDGDSINSTVGSRCTWTISVASPNQTALVFELFSLQTKDYVVVYDGKKNGTNIVANITGKKDAFLVVAFSKKIIIEFYRKSNSSVNMKFSYNTKECSVHFMMAYARRVISPLYLKGRGNVRCQYRIPALPQDQDKVAALAFVQMNIQHGSLLISDGSSSVNVTGSASSNLPNDFIADSGEINITISFPKSKIAQTFDAVFTSVDSMCSPGVMVIDQHLTVSLSVPPNQSPLTDCRWILRANTSGTLLLKITALQLVQGADKVIFHDGGSLGSRPISEMDNIPSEGSVVLSSGREVWMRFLIGDLPGKRVFKVDVYVQANGGRFYTKGNVTLPSSNDTVPDAFYQFIAPEGQQVQITPGQNASLYPVASLDFHDGGQPNSKLLVTFKSETQFFPVTSSGNAMLLVAKNFSYQQSFSAKFTSVDHSCSMISSASRGGYSLRSSPVARKVCRWTIKPQNTQGTIVLQLSLLNLGDAENITVYSGVQEYGMRLAFLDKTSLGAQMPLFSALASRGMELVYESNDTRENCTDPILTASYTTSTTVCGGNLSSPLTSLQSPGYPNLYPINTDCVWRTIVAPSNVSTNTTSNITTTQLLYLTFSDFQLGQGHSVQVKDIVNETAHVVAQYGGATRPKDLIVTVERGAVEFSAAPRNGSDVGNVGRGFKARMWNLECGGNFTTTQAMGNFSTPDYPKPVANSTLCVWIIHFPEHGRNSTVRNSVQFTITLGKSKKNASEVLTVHDGGSMWDPVLQIGGKKDGVVIARTNSILVLYNYTAKSDLDAAGTGFYLNFTAFSCNTSCQCGGSGVCIHPDWVCNGVDDCGDMTDEKNCQPGPAPAPGSKSGLVKTFWVPVCLVLGVLFGIVLAFLIPAIYKRLKYTNYSQLRDLSAPVVT